MYRRKLIEPLMRALSDSPVVLLNGARQTGKTTLVRELLPRRHPARYYTLDDPGILAAIKADPAGFLAGLTGPVILDEIQRAPEIFVAIKLEVDKNRQPGRFLLTGSANVLLLPRLSESLAGRMEVLTLWPLSQGEVSNRKTGFVDAAFGKLPGPPRRLLRGDKIIECALRGGFPEVVGRKDEERRNAWYASYITTILQRDVRDLANIDGLVEMPRLLALLAARAMTLQNFSELSRSSGLPQTTLKRYLTLLETVFLIQTLPPWSGNLSHRLVKSPKVMLSDTGLMAYLQGMSKNRLAIDSSLKGALIENFAGMELRKQITWSQTKPRMFHFRTHENQEVDFVLEDRAGNLVGIEIKSSATVGSDDFKGLRVLAAETGKKFHRGLVLYLGIETIPFGENLHAMPLGAMWEIDEPGAKK